MQITGRTLGLLLVAVLLVGLSAYHPGFLYAAALWLLLLLAFLLADWRLSPTAGHWQLTRRHDNRLSLAPNNPVTIYVGLRRSARPLPARPIQVWLRDDIPATFHVDEADRLLHGTVEPGKETAFVYYVYPPRRGDYQFDDMHLRWQSVLGLLRLQATFPATEPVKVYPNIAEIKKYDLLLRKNRLWELGLRNARIFGSGTEFERLRDYLPDDEYRRINWAATARRGKPISIEYETERSQNIMALLDVGRMMRSPVGDVAKLDYAINAVLLLSYVAAQKGDKVGLLTFADEPIHWLAPRSGKGQFHRMLEQLYAIESQPVEPDYNRAFGYFAAKQHKRGLALVFSDLTGSVSTEALVAQMTRLRHRHLALLVTVRDPTVQRFARQDVVDSASLYQRTVAEQLLEERRLILDQLQSSGVHTLDVAADELSVAVINRYLELKARTMI